METRAQIIEQVRQYFDIAELVCPHVYKMFGNSEFVWNLLRIELLETIVALRHEILCLPMTVNNYKSGGQFDERGFRCNLCDIPSGMTKCGKTYCSGHVLGAAIDFDVRGRSAESVRQYIVQAQDRLPHPIRLEDGVNWVHVDVLNDGKNEYIKLFK